MRAVDPATIASIWNTYRDRLDRERRLLREKRLVVQCIDNDLPRASVELRSLYDQLAPVQSELAVLRRVLSKTGIDGDRQGDSEERVEFRFCAPSQESREAVAGERVSGDVLKLAGYAVLWGQLSAVIGGAFQERFERGAFEDSLSDSLPKFFAIEHKPPPLASTATGDLLLEENDDGLHFQVMLNRRDRAVMLVEPQFRSGRLRQMSFGFRAQKEVWTEERGRAIRTVLKARLLEVSAVRYPAFKQTSVSVVNRSWQVEHENRARMLQLMKL